MGASLAQPAAHVLASSGGFLIEPGVGLMVWTLLVFGLTMLLLARLAFPRISEALGRRQKAIEDSIDSAERARVEADQLLEEYRERLKEARSQSDEIVTRARQAAEVHEQEARERGQEIISEATRRAERDIEMASQRALEDIRRQVADLTILATEKVTRKSLDSEDQRRLVEQALSELDFSGISSGPSQN